MKIIVLTVVLFLNACFQNPLENPRNTSPVDVNKPDDTSSSFDTNADFNSDDSDDVKSAPEMNLVPPNFPDPDRVNHTPCENHLECNRISACRNERCSMRVTGCGWFARPHPSRDTGCLLDEYGNGQESTAECKEDSDCPSNMPNCILRMCQVNARCKMDSDCVGEQFCDYDTWCAIRAPCRENGRCWRGGCRADGFCSYPSD